MSMHSPQITEEQLQLIANVIKVVFFQADSPLPSPPIAVNDLFAFGRRELQVILAETPIEESAEIQCVSISARLHERYIEHYAHYMRRKNHAHTEAVSQ